MASIKTVLTPEEQWKRTIQYVMAEDRRSSATLGRRLPHLLWVVQTPHRLLSLGDVLVITSTNGMNERYAMSGVSSKGALLKGFYIALRPRSAEFIELPGDLIDLQWDDPAVGRFVADLRASSRRRVGASSPAPQQETSSLPLQGLQFDGCYRSRAVGRHKRQAFFRRNYLRFFPGGKVVADPDGGFSATHRQNFVRGPWGATGTYTLDANAISISITLDGRVVEQYTGTIDGAYLRLSRRGFNHWSTSCDDDVYKFSPWTD